MLSVSDGQTYRPIYRRTHRIIETYSLFKKIEKNEKVFFLSFFNPFDLSFHYNIQYSLFWKPIQLTGYPVQPDICPHTEVYIRTDTANKKIGFSLKQDNQSLPNIDCLDLPDIHGAVEWVLAGEGPLPYNRHCLPSHQHCLLLRLLLPAQSRIYAVM